MAIIIDPERDAQIRNEINGRFLGFKRQAHLTPFPEETVVDASWSLRMETPSTPVTRRTEELFRSFMRTCMDVPLNGNKKNQIHFRIDPDISGREAAVIQTDDHDIRITAGHERGLLHAAMRLLRRFANRQAPFIEKGRIDNAPRFDPRLSTTIFYRSNYKLADLDTTYPHEYLALMALYGINGIFWEIDFLDLCQSEVLPELTCANYTDHIARVQDYVERLGSYGIDVYLLHRIQSLPEDHPVFQGHPDIRGAQIDFGGGDERAYTLCSSHERVLAFYEEGFTRLHRDVPGLEGPILIIGGERFTHCFTRPKPPLKNKTNCPRCARQAPAPVIARLVNRVADAVHAECPDARVFFWPYSAFTWSGPEDPCQLELLARTDRQSLLLSNFETNDTWEKTGASLVDYNIMLPGPSTLFRTQQAEMRKTGRPIYAKAECSTIPELFQVPYLPLPYRWAQRAAALQEPPVQGVFYHWRYYGFSGNLADEIALEAAWENLPIDQKLEQYSRRQYGEFSPELLEAWRLLSAAWDEFPYSMALAGDRQYYVKGPMYLGPAHPFIFNVQTDYGLRRGFTRIRGSDLFPDVPDAERERRSNPAYASDLFWTWPMGVETCEKALETLLAAWRRGAGLFASGLKRKNSEARLDLGIMEILEMHFRTTLNLLRFYRDRDRFLHEGGGREDMERRLQGLQTLLREEIQHSTRALELLQQDSRLGYGYAYGIAYDIRMIREKITQCEYVLHREIPATASQMRFHLFGIFP